MAKLVMSTDGGEAWRAYAKRAARYAAQLRALGLPWDHPERTRAREAYKRGIVQAKRDQRKHDAARRIIRALKDMKTKKALAAA